MERIRLKRSKRAYQIVCSDVRKRNGKNIIYIGRTNNIGIIKMDMHLIISKIRHGACATRAVNRLIRKYRRERI
ncbi:hypothetical protein [Candidatus Vidania fulgoroideorum]